MSASKPSVFLLKVTGQIETGEFLEDDQVYFTYFYYYGQDWQVIKGIEEGSSQTTRRSDDERSIFVWNFPIDVTFKSTNPFGWPQIVLSLFGCDFFGNDVVRGYAVCHLPIAPGRYTKRLPTFVPDSASTLQKLVSLFSGRRPEFVDPKTIAQGRGREVVRVRSQGYISVTFDVIFRDFNKLGYNSGQLQMPHSKADGILSKMLRDEKEAISEKEADVSDKEVDDQQPSTSKATKIKSGSKKNSKAKSKE